MCYDLFMYCINNKINKSTDSIQGVDPCSDSLKYNVNHNVSSFIQGVNGVNENTKDMCVFSEILYNKTSYLSKGMWSFIKSYYKYQVCGDAIYFSIGSDNDVDKNILNCLTVVRNEFKKRSVYIIDNCLFVFNRSILFVILEKEFDWNSNKLYKFIWKVFRRSLKNIIFVDVSGYLANNPNFFTDTKLFKISKFIFQAEFDVLLKYWILNNKSNVNWKEIVRKFNRSSDYNIDCISYRLAFSMNHVGLNNILKWFNC